MTRMIVILLLGVAACRAERSPAPRAAASRDAGTREREPVRHLDPPAAPGAMAPNLEAAGDAVLATWLERSGTTHRLRFSRLSGETWSDPVTVVENDGIVANWADVPSVTQGAGGVLVAHWAEATDTRGEAYDVILGRSTDAGRTWQRIGPAHDDGTASEHGFVSLVPDGDTVRAFWLDGRDLVGGHATGHGSHGAMTLRTAVIRGAVSEGASVDTRVCDCCGTGAASTADGSLVVYRDRSDDEIRDISIVRRIDGKWTAPHSIHDDGWKIAGCPVNGPAVDVHKNRAAVAWYTYADARPGVRAAFSEDGGATFGPPVEVDRPLARHAPVGRVGIVLDEDGDAIVSWLASERDHGTVYLRRVTADGKLGAPRAVVESSPGRDAGFPRLARHADGVIVAWTEASQPSRVRAALIRLSDVPRAMRSPDVAASAQPERRAVVGQAAPTFAAQLLDGAAAALAALRGEVVLVNLWATWCEPCRQELPVLVALHERWAARGLRVIGVSVDQQRSPAEVRASAERRGVPYAIWVDREDRASDLFGAGALPVTLLIDRKGVIVWRHDGAISSEDASLESAISASLAR